MRRVLFEHELNRVENPGHIGFRGLPFASVHGPADEQAHFRSELRQKPPHGHGFVPAEHGDWDDRHPHLHGEGRCARLRLADLAAARARALGEDQNRHACPQQAPRHPRRLAVLDAFALALAQDRIGVEKDGREGGDPAFAVEIIGRGAGGELFCDPVGQKREDHGRVQVRGVIGHQDEGAFQALDVFLPQNLGFQVGRHDGPGHVSAHAMAPFGLLLVEIPVNRLEVLRHPSRLLTIFCVTAPTARCGAYRARAEATLNLREGVT